MRIAAVLGGVLLMAQVSESISAEPGKQLAQSVTVRADQDGAERETTIHYLLFVPQDYTVDGKPWPLMLFLHGLGESGNNELAKVKIHGPAGFVDKRPDFPFVVVSPQLPPPPRGMDDVPTAWQSDPLIQLLDHVSNELNIDRTRVYCTGLSMGGFGTWRIAAKYPERFAAIAPICGGGEPAAMAASLRRVPTWAFHGALDKLVPLSKSEEMVQAVRCAGGDVQLTVYDDVAHDSWKRAYANEALYTWLLSHRGPLD